MRLSGTRISRGIAMRKLSLMLLASTTFALAASQASAADLPRKAPAYVPPAPPPITGPDVTSAPTSAGYLAMPRRIWVLEESLQTIPDLLVAVRLAAIINSPADG